VRSRDRGQRDLRLWEDLAVLEYDRVRAQVRAFRFPGGSFLPVDDHYVATQEAWLRVVALGRNFAGSTLFELRAALRTTVVHACMDFGQRKLRRERHAAGSLDEPSRDGVSGSRYDAAVAARSRELAAIEADEDARQEEREDARKLVAWALEQMKNEGHREVLRLTVLEGLSGDEVAQRLGITTDNVYQRRRRGLKTLETIFRDHRP